MRSSPDMSRLANLKNLNQHIVLNLLLLFDVEVIESRFEQFGSLCADVHVFKNFWSWLIRLERNPTKKWQGVETTIRLIQIVNHLDVARNFARCDGIERDDQIDN